MKSQNNQPKTKVILSGSEEAALLKTISDCTKASKSPLYNNSKKYRNFLNQIKFILNYKTKELLEKVGDVDVLVDENGKVLAEFLDLKKIRQERKNLQKESIDKILNASELIPYRLYPTFIKKDFKLSAVS